ncbi:MAG: RNA polymerase sigma factor [Myxococcota bacterium]
MDDPDEPWVQAARRGDRTAMKELYRRHAPKVRSYAHRACGGADLADDVTQETFIRAFRGLKNFNGRSKFSTWLLTIAVNRTRTELSRRRPTQSLDELQTVPNEAMVTMKAQDVWTQKRLAAALEELPEGYRSVVVLHDVLGMEHQEIAEIRGCSVGTSKSQLHKARAKLRALLGPNPDLRTARREGVNL